ncbi:MAG: glycosyltransferase family 39 protein [Candidatus Daviesbacteria bacterium]|nr:glycosyltransferase family 39 protein [Candidatus Daviesbacteria bacterium]
MLKILLIGLVLFLAVFLRIVNISETPPVYLDEASIGYDAYSLSIRSKDQYGEPWPVFFRSYANFQSPIYIYLTAVSVKILGLTPVSIRLVSILSGMVIILSTYFLIKILNPEFKFRFYTTLILTVSPWAVFFSRGAMEANLGLAIFTTSLYLIFKGLFKKRGLWLILGIILLALTNFGYHAYRLISFGTLFLLILIFYRQLSISLKKVTFLGIACFILILIPQILLLNTPGSLERFKSLEYFSTDFFQANGGELRSQFLGHYQFIILEFFGKYLDYLSLKSLFFDTDPTLVRGIPEMAVFYQWMCVPFIVGLYFLIRERVTKIRLFFILLGLISLIPAALTRDNLYELRVLPFLWTVSILISQGLTKLSQFKKFWPAIIGVVLIMSLIPLYTNYFHLLKYERNIDHSGFINDLFKYTKDRSDKKFIVSLSEPLSYGVALYIYQYDPREFEKSLNFNLENYYTDLTLKTEHNIKNLQIRQINWEVDTFEEVYLAGDEQTISRFKVEENGLEEIVIFRSPLDIRSVTIYKTNPKFKCLARLEKDKVFSSLNQRCQIILK